ncbi:MAG: glycosyltransferase [Leptospiraceae bacterium]|nr:glycosyltransferase [Leptospiraceae bacterium]
MSTTRAVYSRGKQSSQGALRIALVHDWLTGMRGGEVVLEALLELFPDADLYTLLYTRGSVSTRISERRIITSFIDRLPFKDRWYRHYLPLFPTAIESLDLRNYDLIFSSSHCVARGVLPAPGSLHLSYFHSPIRYAWDMQWEYFPLRGFLNRFLIPFITHYLRLWDYAVRDRVDHYICNSHFVQERIQRFYGKNAEVIYPPCFAEEELPALPEKWPPRSNYYLVLSALVPYKRIDQAIAAFRDLPERRLIVVGTGPEESRLRKMAPSNVEFTGRLEHAELKQYYAGAQALLFPGKEDFGIVPIEAQAQLCPVIAYGAGGALDTVQDGVTGVLYSEQSVTALQDAIRRHETLRYSPSDFHKNIKKFSNKAFRKAIIKAVRQRLPDWRPPDERRPR